MTNEWKYDTQEIHCEQSPEKEDSTVAQAIIPAVAYAFESANEAADVVTGEKTGPYYGRYGKPTTDTLERKIAVLENAEAALGVSSGMAAITTALLTYLRQGDHVVVTKDVYGGTHKFLMNIDSQFGITYDFIDFNEDR